MTAENSQSSASEAAAIRRRWITLAEVLGTAGVIISALALWNSYQERTRDEAEKAALKRESAIRAQALVLRGMPDPAGTSLSLAPADPSQAIQSQTVVFPAAIAATPVETVADPRIEAHWFERQLLRAMTSDEARESETDRQVTIAIITRFYRDGALFRDAALYSLVYRIEGGGLLEGREIRLRGLSRLQTVAPDLATVRGRVDRLWTRGQGPARPAD